MRGNITRLDKIFLYSKDTIKSGIFWNMVASMCFAFQSVFMTIILSRVVDKEYSGYFQFAYGAANFFLMIGKFGLRDFQISDVRKQYSFYDYRSTKYITISIMFLSSLLFCCKMRFLDGDNIYYVLCVFTMCLQKVLDAFEEVFYAHYQRNRRLDIAGKVTFTRIFLMFVVFVITILVAKDLLTALIVPTVIGALFTIFSISSFFPKSNIEETDIVILGRSKDTRIKPKVQSLLVTGFPLFLGIFLQYYICSFVYKSAIKSEMDDISQAIYGYISMPVFVIELMSNFIFSPLLVGLSDDWQRRNLASFKKVIFRQIAIVATLTIVCVIGGAILGIPVLSLLFNCDLAKYKIDFLILLTGGGFLALSTFLMSIIVVIRYQKYTAIGYIIATIIAFFISKKVVGDYGILGSTVLYLSLMVILCICFSIIFMIGYFKQRKEKTQNYI